MIFEIIKKEEKELLQSHFPRRTVQIVETIVIRKNTCTKKTGSRTEENKVDEELKKSGLVSLSPASSTSIKMCSVFSLQN